MNRTTMILHREWLCFLEKLSNEELGIWLRSLLSLMETGEMPQNLDRPVEVAFYAAYERVERDWEKLDRRMANLKQNQPKPGSVDCPKELEPDIFQLYQQHFGMLTPIALSDLIQAQTTLGHDLTVEILSNSIANGAKKWSYLHTAFEQAIHMGLSSPEDYRLAHLRDTGRIVDRPAPGTIPLFKPRPLRLKRTD